jgi:arylsulfatase A-like enzyme
MAGEMTICYRAHRRRSVRAPAAAALLTAALAAAACAGDAPAERPSTNVVLISIDCLNQRQFREALDHGWVPALARVAADALVFSDAHAHAPWTTPSHMSMLTGLYPIQHGRDVPWGLMTKTNQYFDRVPLFPTLGDLLGSAGYETVAFVGKGSISGQFGLNQGFELFQESAKAKQTDLPVSVERCLSWLGERSDRPFFLFFHTYDLHSPRAPQLGSDQAALRYIDRHVGKVLADLEARGLYESTLIFVTGDHGSSMVRTEDKCCVHGSGHYEENLNVPLVVKLPGSASKGTSERLVRHIDILPTALDVIGLPAQEYRGRGASVLAVTAEGESRISFSSADARCARRFALADGTYKYIYSPRDELQTVLRGDSAFMDSGCRGVCTELPAIEELYDLRRDPFESRNLLAAELDSDTQGVLAGLRERMIEHMNLPPEYVRRVVGSPGEAIDLELEESLRALGYIR